MPEAHDRPGFTFGPDAPPDVTGYLRNKSLRPSFSWLDVEPEEHAFQFAVAKAVNIDVLTAIKGELQKAIDEGLPFDAFKRELRPKLQKLGWWGIRRRRDPVTGKERLVRLGSPRRLKTIYDANLRTARAAGEWNRIQRTKGGLPYLLYELGPSENHRPEHVAMAGTIRPVDDPLWQVWYTPNGWGCKCRLRQLTRAQAERRGISEPVTIRTREWINRRTGEVKDIPVGIDPGWERNPGIERRSAMERLLVDKLDQADPAIARAATADMVDSWRFRRIQDGGAGGMVPVSYLSEAARDALGARTRVVMLSSQTAAKQLQEHAEVGPDAYRLIGDAFERGTVYRHGTSMVFFMTDDDTKLWHVVIKRTVSGKGLFLTSIRRSNPRRRRNFMSKDGVELLRGSPGGS